MEYFVVNAKLGSFFLAALLLAAAPGPDNLFVLAQSALYGRRAGLLVTLGLCTGLIVHTALVGIGVAALLASFPAALRVLKVVGALYLLYLAWQALRDGWLAPRSERAVVASGAKLYRRGIIMNVTNPKVLIYFLAFLPQFIVEGGAPVILQVGVLGLLFAMATLLVFGSMALLAAQAVEYFAADCAARRALNLLAALVLVAIAAYLLLSGG